MICQTSLIVADSEALESTRMDFAESKRFLNGLLSDVETIFRENGALKEMNARLTGTILAKNVEIEALKKELKEFKEQYG